MIHRPVTEHVTGAEETLQTRLQFAAGEGGEGQLVVLGGDAKGILSCHQRSPMKTNQHLFYIAQMHSMQ